jgi:methionyl-tRNA synthetase
MVYKNCDTIIPDRVDLTAEDNALLNQAYATVETIRPMIDKFQFNRALEEIWRLVSAANTYIDDQAPWGLKKTDPKRMGVVLSVICETVRCLGILILPVMPTSGDAILDQLKIDPDERHFGCLDAEHAITSGVIIDKPEGVFPRIDAEEKAI